MAEIFGPISLLTIMIGAAIALLNVSNATEERRFGSLAGIMVAAGSAGFWGWRVAMNAFVIEPLSPTLLHTLWSARGG